MNRPNDESKQAFKSSSFRQENDTTVKSLYSHRSQSNSCVSLSSASKKWFDILATDDENCQVSSEKINSMNSELMQQPLSSTSSTNTISGGVGDFSMHACQIGETSRNDSEYSVLTQHLLSKSEVR